MFVTGFPSELTATNCWVLAVGDGEQCVVVDPGIGVVGQLDEVIAEHRLHPVAVLLTHGHYDHTFSVVPVCAARDVAAYIHPADRAQLTDPWTALGRRPGEPLMGLENLTFAEPADVRQLDDNAALSLAGLQFTVRHSPGHTPGSVLFAADAASTGGGHGVMVSGDVLFAGSIGRTDLPGGSMAQMNDSLQRVVLTFADETVVLPGHGPSTTIGRERQTNPYLHDLRQP